MPLNAKPSCGWPFKPVSVGASPTRGANFVREGDLVDSSPSQGEDSRSVTATGAKVRKHFKRCTGLLTRQTRGSTEANHQFNLL